MNEVNKYLNDLDIGLLFDDGKPGKVYVLNPEKTSIYFIIDVDDSCLYINQDILNIYPEKEIKAFLNEIGLEMDIFPYFEEPSDIEDLKPSKQKYLELLMENTTSIKIDFSEYGNYIFLFNKDMNIIKYNSKNGFLDNDYDDIWLKIKPKNDYRFEGTQRIIKETVEKHFKNVVTSPVGDASLDPQGGETFQKYKTMTEINKYLDQLNLRLVFDDGKPGRIYILNPEKTYIYFIIDVDDSCLYINQDILNIYPEKEIKAFLEYYEVGMDIFPYFEEPSDIEDLKPSTQQYFELLMMITMGIKIDFNEYSNYIFLYNKGNEIIQYDLKYDYIYNRYDVIWSKIQTRFEYNNYAETQQIIKETVERHFKNRVITPRMFFRSVLPYIGEETLQEQGNAL